jgi:hypothetical protein
MYSVNARRSEVSPNRMSLDRHSCRREHTQRSAKAFRFGLRGGRANGRIPLDRRIIQKRSAEFCIPIVKKVAHATEESRTLVGGVASHLNHPLGGRMSGQTGETDAARFQMNEEQDVVGGEASPGEHFDGEEVGTCQDGHVRGDEILPGGILAPLGCRLDPVSAKDVAHRLIGNGVAEIARAPTMRSYPQPEFSLAKRTMSASSSGAMRGRPGEVRNLEPSNLRAMSRRYQARMVSGLATQATC